MEKRTIVALALSFLVLGLYPVFLEKFYPQTSVRPAVQTAPRPSDAPAVPDSSRLSAPADETRLVAGEDTVYDNGSVHAAFNPRGGVIRELSFPSHAHPETQRPLEFISAGSLKDSPALVAISTDGSTYVPLAGEYRIEKQTGGLRLEALTDQQGLSVSKEFAFGPSGHAGRLTLVLANRSTEAKEFHYQLFVGPSAHPRASIDSQYIEGNFYSDVDGAKKLEHPRESKAGKVKRSRGPVEWVATKDRHFSLIVKPESATGYYGLVQGLGDHRFNVSVVSPRVALPAGGTLRHEFLVYAGPTDLARLEPLGLGAIVNFGKMDGIAKLLIGALELLHGALRNYGLAVIALTALINLLLFPFTRLSYQSMKRMQLIQPQMSKLRDQHKNNPQKLNKEMMELYRKHKVNPFGGCLPMLLQMPVFIALYVALSKFVPMVNARFLWIGDLSTPDVVPIPLALPFLGDRVHALPLVMVAAMFFQQRLTQVKVSGQDPAVEQQQKIMGWMMPAIFGFIFYSMPSGLVLYWLTNTLLMMLYQLRLKNMTLES